MMPDACVSYRKTGYFSKLICDYVEQEPVLKPFYNRFPEMGSFKEQLREKQDRIPEIHARCLPMLSNGNMPIR